MMNIFVGRKGLLLCIMVNKVFNILEYNKILERLASYTESEYVKDKIYALTPSKNLEEASQLQEETTEAVDLMLRYGNPCNLSVPDLLGVIKRSQINGVLSMRELLNIARLLRVTASIKSYLSNAKYETPVLTDICDELITVKDLENEISGCIISEEEMADTASTELKNIRRKMNSLNIKIKDSLNDMIHSAAWRKYLQDPVVTLRGDRYVLPVRAEYRSEIKGIVHDTSSTGATLFVEPMSVVNANNEIRELISKEKSEIERILSDLSSRVSDYANELETDFRLVSRLDFIFAKGKMSIDMDARAPVLNDDGYIFFKKARHPLIDKKYVVSNDIYLGDTFDQLVITGPNTGGKTVTLKTIGLFSLMAAAGLHIPVEENSHAAVFEHVFADIGDEQSIEQSLSTFSSHMVNIVDILNHVNYNSLVLFDELGAGTDPTEGAALAISILEKLQLIGSKVAATTHYSELKMFALSTHRVENASCEFDVNSLKPTYKLLIGVPGKSNAFSISERLGLDKTIIEHASNMLSDENIKFEDIVTDLERNRVEAEREKQKTEKLRKELDVLHKTIEKQKQDLEDTKQRILDEARREAKIIVLDAKEESRKLIKELNSMKLKADKSQTNAEIEKVRKRLKSKEDEINATLTSQPAITTKYVQPKNLKIGTTVKLINLDQEADVISLPDKDGNLFVQAGIIKIKSHISNIRTLTDSNIGKDVKKAGRTPRTESFEVNTSTVPREIDLRGQSLEDAMMNTDKFLDDAYLASLKEVTVIHGKGTGVLRNGIQDMLRHHKHVKSFRLGKYGEGENGVTIVELK